MRALVEVWILVWILVTRVPLFAVGVYDVDYPIPVVETAGQIQGHRETHSDDIPRTDNNQDPLPGEITASDTGSGRRTGSADVQGPLQGLINMEREPVQCVELKSKRYISDGFCTSIRPITEVVCAGTCIPNPEWYATYIKTYGNRKRKEWRCVNDSVRQKKVTLVCDDGDTRTYRIKTVRTCKCKRLQNQHNQSQHRMVDEFHSRQSSNRNRRNRNNRQ